MADMTYQHFLRSSSALRTITSTNWTKTFAAFLVLLCVVDIAYCSDCSTDSDCLQGKCVDSFCECEQGWAGDNCEHCGGRVKLDTPTGYIADGPNNYKLAHSCTWLIDSGLHGSLIRLKFEHFQTECAWDYLYIYDGDSIYDPLVATFSGAILSENEENSTHPEVTTSSGFAYLHFYSDAAYAMEGFNISYSIDTCQQACSGNGKCLNTTECECDSGWTGEGCHIPVCLHDDDCGNHGDCVSEQCKCNDGYKGYRCEVPPTDGHWEVNDDKLSQGRASHASVVQDNIVWIVGGYPFTNQQVYENIIRYDIESDTAIPVSPKSSVNPEPRYGHSLVLDEDRLIMYGGTVRDQSKVVNELWFFNISQESWEFYDVAVSSRVAVDGHTAHMVDKTMIVIFGYSPIHGYTNMVQEFDTVTGKWSVVETTGVNVNGAYGHSSVYDEVHELIYVFGGVKAVTSSSSFLSHELYAYDPTLQHWTVLPSSGGHYVYLHSSVLIDGIMYSFGGNPHNDTFDSSGALCFSSNLLAYDTKCESWSYIPLENEIYTELSRFGHSGVTYDGKMFVISGYNNIMLTDVPGYTPGNCSAFDQEDACLSGSAGISCTWLSAEGRCDNAAVTIGTAECPESNENTTVNCDTQTDCNSCELTYGCTWSNDVCTSNYTANNNSSSCSNDDFPCRKFYTCGSCALNEECYWYRGSCRYTSYLRNSTCDTSCSDNADCGACTDSNCMWCASTQRCIDSNAYTTAFPYGQCMGWHTNPDSCPGVDCSQYSTCDDCHENPGCGWCDDGSNTGLGTCMEGSYSEPESGNSCPSIQWFFVECPACQCNGHSQCINESICEDCQDYTEGEECEECTDRYYGDPTNGGNCTACFCNGHAEECDNKSGECSCTTKGIIGHECERCDENRKYYGDPTNGTCYYELLMNYRYLFNLSKADDEDVTAINFKCHIDGNNRDVEFNLNTDYPALLKITYTSKSSPKESVAYEESVVQNTRIIFSRNDYNFQSSQNFTFYAYISNFTTPFGFDISFSWRMVYLMDLLLFFITFFTCFLGLLVIAGIVWKVKQKYDGYRRRQARIIEMKQMAKRPFAVMRIEIDKQINSSLVHPTAAQGKASAVAIEPCFGDKAAILNLLIRLPCSEKGYSPDGYNGMTVGTALVHVNSKKMGEHKDKGGSIRRRKQQRGSVRGVTNSQVPPQTSSNGNASSCANQLEAVNGSTNHHGNPYVTHHGNQWSTTHSNQHGAIPSNQRHVTHGNQHGAIPSNQWNTTHGSHDNPQNGTTVCA